VQQVATRERYANDDDHHRHHGHKHRYQKSWLSEIFD
jgi:Zn-finger nucleic acid-binding protein